MWSSFREDGPSFVETLIWEYAENLCDFKHFLWTQIFIYMVLVVLLTEREKDVVEGKPPAVQLMPITGLFTYSQ
jgi:hypothetical protein